MENKEAIALIAKHWLANIDFITASVHAEIDLTNRIEMLESLPSGILISQKDTPYYVELITNLKQQLEYLNNL